MTVAEGPGSKNLAQNTDVSGYDALNVTESRPSAGTKPVRIERSVSPTTVLTPINSNSSEESIAHILSASWDPHIDRQLRQTPARHLSTPKLATRESWANSRTPLLRSKSQPTSRRASVASTSNFNRFAQNYIIPAAKWAYSPITGQKKRKKSAPCELDQGYSIEYSVFKPIRSLPSITTDREFMIHWKNVLEDETGEPFDFPENYMSSNEFNNLVNTITDLIEIDDLKPERIAQGSSGSYFIYGKESIEFGLERTYKVGVFKPKDEEPYGPLSPKWTKWMHRTFFPCFFGRSCLIPNLGYVSEAAACVLDKQLLSYIVPYTSIIYLKSPTFYYSYWDKSDRISKLPLKIGSFQVFLNGYMEAQSWFRIHPVPEDIIQLPENSNLKIPGGVSDTSKLDSQFYWSKQLLQQFREELEKLVILDYIMRNTDRGLDNWMIKISWKTVSESSSNTKTYKPVIKVGAIDSGLAFPWKRPDEWRSFPFGWLFLPLSIIGQPFSMKTRNHYLPLLTSKYWWEQTVTKLRQVFEVDKDFKERLWNRQLAVLKGQAFNVVEILKLSYAGPLELTRRENLLIWDDTMYIPKSLNDEIIVNAMESSIYDLAYSGSNRVSVNTGSRIESSKFDPQSSRYEPISEESPGAEDHRESDENESPTLIPQKSCNLQQQQQLGSPILNGYDYNVNRVEHERDESDDAENQTGNRKVIIERLEKGDSKPPVFTWC